MTKKILEEEQLKYILNQIHEQIRFADGKAKVLMGFNFIALLISLLKDNGFLFEGGILRGTILIALLFCILFAFISSVFAVIAPRLRNTMRTSKIFFGDIANKYPLDKERVSLKEYLTKYPILETEKTWREDLISQIIVNANIATKKHYYIKKSVQLLIIGIFIFFILMCTSLGEKKFSPIESNCHNRHKIRHEDLRRSSQKSLKGRTIPQRWNNGIRSFNFRKIEL